MQTYISQNQNALATSLIGDVATVFGGLAMIGSQGAIGTGATLSGLNGIINRQAMIEDMANKTSNPPAFLGTALASFFNRQFWTIVTKQAVDNANQVHGNYGYPLNKVASLTFPSSGYIKTQGCSVTTDGTVPTWAIEEINQMFNNGVQVH